MDSFTYKHRTDLSHPKSCHRIAGTDETTSDHTQLQPSFHWHDLELLASEVAATDELGLDLPARFRQPRHIASTEQNIVDPGIPGSLRSLNSKSSRDVRPVQTPQELLTAHQRGHGFGEMNAQGKFSEPWSAGRLRPRLATPESKTTPGAKVIFKLQGHALLRRSPRKRVQRSGNVSVSEPASMRSWASKSELLPEPAGSQYHDTAPVNLDGPASGLRDRLPAQ